MNQMASAYPQMPVMLFGNSTTGIFTAFFIALTVASSYAMDAIVDPPTIMAEVPDSSAPLDVLAASSGEIFSGSRSVT